MKKLDFRTQAIMNSDFVTTKEKEELASRKLKMQDVTKVIRVNLSNLSGTQDLITDSTTKVIGISDFSGLTLPNTCVFDSITVKQGEPASGAGGASAAYTRKTATVKNGLLNSKLIIAHDGKPQAELSVSALCTEAEDNLPSANNGYELVAPIVFAKTKESSIKLAIPVSLAPTATKDLYVEVTLIGSELVTR